MKQSVRVFLATVVATAAASVPAAVQAHFKLLEPASAIVENERGDPQKAAPCGGSADAKPSDAVTKVTGGSKLHLKVLETIYHPVSYTHLDVYKRQVQERLSSSASDQFCVASRW